MMKWQRRIGTAAFAVMVATVLSFAGTTPSRAQLLPGLHNWLSGQDQDNGRRGFLFRRWGDRQQQQDAAEGGPVPPLTPFQLHWLKNPLPGFPTLDPQNIETTQRAIYKYQDIVTKGGWPQVPAVAMGPGSRGRAVVILHQRLAISGDLVGRSIPNEYDAALVRAVKKFQVRHGLPPTGKIDQSTLKALNIPAYTRLRELQASLPRLQALVPKVQDAKRYVFVNIPAAQTEAVQNGHVAQRHIVVVGQAGNLATPTLQSKIFEINFNPYWYVPKSIIRNDLVPKARQLQRHNMDFLKVYHMDAFDPSGQQLTSDQINWYSNAVYNDSFRQQPWAQNSLGFVRLNFYDPYAVYMHDTPEKNLFNLEYRYRSHGCVRVHNVAELVAWLLDGNPGWNLHHVLQMKQTGEQLTVKLPKSVPVLFGYIDAWATPDGVVHFRPDVYHMDASNAQTASAG